MKRYDEMSKGSPQCRINRGAYVDLFVDGGNSCTDDNKGQMLRRAKG